MMIPILAWRNIWRNKVRSLIIMGSVGLGVLAGLFILALYKGMIDSRIRTVIEDEVSHLQIHHPEFNKDQKANYTIHPSYELTRFLQNLDEVRDFSSRAVTYGMLATATGSSGVHIRGIDPAQEDRVSSLSNKIIEGAYFSGMHKHELLIGKSLANKKGLQLNKKVVITVSDRDNNIVSGAFRITGIYQSTNTALDERIVYARFDEIAGMLGTLTASHEIAVVLKDDTSLDTVQTMLSKHFPLMLTENWKELTPETELLITATNQSNFIILVIIMLTLAFGIINTMLMAILERTREIGMMIALGMNHVKLFLLVLLETTLLTIVGSPFGILLAWLLTGYLGDSGIDTTAFAGSTMGDFGFQRIVYPQFPTADLGRMVLIISGTALLSSILPALRAIRMEPADALRK